MNRAVLGSVVLAAGTLALTGSATADSSQGRERHAPAQAASAPAPPPQAAPAPPPPPRQSAPPPQAVSRGSGERHAPSDGGRSSDSGRARAVPRDGSGSERAVSRTSGGEQPVVGGAPTPTEDVAFASRARRARGPDGGQTNRAVPRADRPRDGRTVVGQARPRTGPPYSGPTYWRPSYYRPSYWYSRPSYWYGYGAFGLGYFYYDPYWWGGSYWGGAPFGYAGYGGYGGYGPGYDGYGPGYGGAVYSGEGYGSGELRLKVKPRDAEVHVDGYFVGLVDDYDGVFQRLTIDSGAHRIEIRKPGFETLSFEVRVPPGQTVTYRGELEKVP
jgi:hypothetical protein